MPELPEVETVVRQIRPGLVGATVLRLQLHTPRVMRCETMPCNSLRRQKILAVERRGKFIRIRLTGHLALLVHLRMTGHLEIVPESEVRGKHDHADLVLDNGRRLRFTDMRKFGGFHLLDDRLADRQPPLSQLGPEPLEISLDDFRRLLRHNRRGIKALLLDQRKLAGMGNIYCDEALFQAGIHPARPADRIPPKQAEMLWHAMRRVLLQAIEQQGSSIGSFVTPEGRSGSYQQSHLAYGRAGLACTRCQTIMRRLIVAGRGTTVCPKCQRAPRRR